MFSKFLTRALLTISCVLCVINLTAGVSADTTIQTQEGPKLIKIIKVGDKILCSNMKDLSLEEREVSAIQEVAADSVVEITTSDNVTFYVTPDQKLFVTHKWVEAKNLTLEDVLMTNNKTFVRIAGIRHLDMPMTLRFITVDEHHNFFAAENGVLIHNGAWGVWVGCTVSMTLTQMAYHGAVCGVSAFAGPAAPAVAGAIYFWTMPIATTATYTAGIAGGLALGVATGPV